MLQWVTVETVFSVHRCCRAGPLMRVKPPDCAPPVPSLPAAAARSFLHTGLPPTDNKCGWSKERVKKKLKSQVKSQVTLLYVVCLKMRPGLAADERGNSNAVAAGGQRPGYNCCCYISLSLLKPVLRYTDPQHCLPTTNIYLQYLIFVATPDARPSLLLPHSNF